MINFLITVLFIATIAQLFAAIWAPAYNLQFLASAFLTFLLLTLFVGVEKRNKIESVETTRKTQK